MEQKLTNPTEQTSEIPETKPVQRFAGVKRWMFRILFYSVGLYLLILVMLAWNETALVYPGSPESNGNWNPETFAYEEVEFKSADGTELLGWYIPPNPEDKKKCRTVLICHGNGENLAQVAGYWGVEFRNKLNAEVFAFDYRGFGKSEGTPTEKAVFEDSTAALEQFCQRAGKSVADVIIVGHSLGGGPAVHLAKTQGCKMLILQRTFSSLPDAASASYPIFPVHWIMQNRMNSKESIKDCNMPLFQSHGNADTLIPCDLGHTLHDCCPSEKKEFFEVDGMGHWDPLPTDYWVKLKAFVNDVCE